jgi:elongation factor Ts
MAEKVSAEQVKTLREATGAGWVDCKNALTATGGELEKAKDWLRTKGLAKAQTRAGRATRQGLIDAYIHHNGQVGVLVEVNCESDFVARTQEFKDLAHELAVHIAGANPTYLRREEVPAELLERERAVYRAQAEEQKKPAAVVEKIVQGQVENFYKSIVLLDQPTLKDPKKKVQDLVNEANAHLKENVTVARFARFKVGEGPPS